MPDWLFHVADRVSVRLAPFGSQLLAIAGTWFANGVFLAISANALIAVANRTPGQDTELVKALRWVRNTAGIVVGACLAVAVVWLFGAVRTPLPDEALAAGVGGSSMCQPVEHAPDATVELQCQVQGADDFRLYQFQNGTALAAWFEKLTWNAAAGTCGDGNGQRTIWTPDSSVGHEFACSSDAKTGAVTLRFAFDAAGVGGQLVRSDGNMSAARAAYAGLRFDLPDAPRAASACPDLPVAWDEDGAGHDNWGSDALDIQVTPCTTVLITTATVQVPNGPTCDIRPNGVCVLALATSSRKTFHITGLAKGATWWGWTNGDPKAAIGDKASLFNPKGVFGSANCDPPYGCTTAEVWIDNDGYLAHTTISHP